MSALPKISGRELLAALVKAGYEDRQKGSHIVLRQVTFPWLLTGLGGAVLYLGLSCAYLFLGQPNADEGWYLCASRLVLEGKRPYQDFAYTQMPLLPYVYGVPQLLSGTGMYGGRATSLALSIGGFVLAVALARRQAGRPAFAATAVLLGTFSYGIYFSSIVKTYALVSLLFLLTFFFLSSRMREVIRLPLAVLAALCAALVRLSAVWFALPIVIYAFTVAGARAARWVTCVVCLGVVVVAAFVFFLPDPGSARWNLITYHMLPWGDASWSGRIGQVLIQRIPSIAQGFAPYILLVVAGFGLACGKGTLGRYLRGNRAMVAVTAGLLLFSGSHLFSGMWHNEYLVPAVICFFPIMGIGFAQVRDAQGGGGGRRSASSRGSSPVQHSWRLSVMGLHTSSCPGTCLSGGSVRSRRSFRRTRAPRTGSLSCRLCGSR